MALETGGVVALLLGSSVLSAVINQVWTAIRDRLKLTKDAGFSALYLAIALEAYAGECAALVGDSRNYHASDGNAGTVRGNIAELPDFPASIDWKALGLKATTKIQSFRVEVETTRAMFKGLWEFADGEEIFPQVREEAARLGLLAGVIAAETRKAHKITAVDYGSGWNVPDYLKGEYDREVANRRRYEEQQRRLSEEMWAVAEPTEQSDTGPTPDAPASPPQTS
ncbi:hypothetical protein QE385_003248 [Sphingomonas sp. SORGH_AS 950]|uniref:hypothetical protein n=1 Tax=Sphingomonas sp. SORGH_AS_0950 TaxID=3041792 RepID=UPI00277D78A9|nr:hypothetical protein [Sphingomonas sp. SORGH_AS_0950]MDQ1158921.1 hypothetical protein [Sphingomonas sp. SORGH_AS_0950]